jgi:ketosteroid isomerase-like protein
MDQRIEIAKQFYQAFAAADRDFVERHLAEDFVFSAPPDPRLDRNGFFERCWPGAGQGQRFTFVRTFAHGSEVVVTYELTSANGKVGRNTEILTFAGDKLCRTEVYFGWTVGE